jgi:hypothetical protein
MEILTSNFLPLNFPNKTFVSRWEELFQEAQFLRIGIGYASNDSLLYLRKLIEFNQPKHLQLCLGMAFFEGMSSSQYQAAADLDKFLTSNQIGEIKVARTFPFHGKVQSFIGNKLPDTFLVGSSNLSNIIPLKGIGRRNYEVDIEISSGEVAKKIDHLMTTLFKNGSVSFESVASQIVVKENPNTLLSSRTDVKLIGLDSLNKVIENLTNNSFEIPLKDSPKSNLNVYFGEGRVSQQGFVKPRHWYEVEIIVDLAVQRSSKNYPANKDFLVYTDDGLRFVMRSSGDYGKNLRSKEDLTILGRWIKGRMEASEKLSSGQLVTNEILLAYGRTTITFTQTKLSEIDETTGKRLKVWYINFRSNKRKGA